MKDLTGKRFGRQIALRPCGKNKYRNVLWLCKCDCGNQHIVASGKLVQGKSKSCGCYALEIRSKSLEKHGITSGGKPRTFVIWNGMKARCLNPKSTSYPNYGGRGIRICDQWLNFENFHYWAISNGYRDDLEIDRIDNDGNYCPENCRWATAKEQANNTRSTVLLTYNGQTKSASEWSRITGISRNTITRRKRSGWTDEECLTIKAGEKRV